MLEIIALIFLARNIGNLAKSKGLSAGKWKAMMIISWFGAEFLGLAIAYFINELSDLGTAFLLAYGLAIISYFIVRDVLRKKPDIDQGFDFENENRNNL